MKHLLSSHHHQSNPLDYSILAHRNKRKKLECRVYNLLSLGTDPGTILPIICSHNHNKVPCALASAQVCYVGGIPEF